MKKKDIKGKLVYFRGSADVPLDKEKDIYDPGKIEDTIRIESFLPALKYLIENGAKIILQPGWLGRPGGEVKKELSVVPVYIYLEKRLKKMGLLKHEMLMAPTELHGEVKSICKNMDDVEKKVSMLKEGQILMLENPRFDPEYDSGDEKYAKDLAALADFYVADDFAQRHRPAADIVPMLKYIPSYAGMGLINEMEYIRTLSDELRKKKRKPFVFILAGKKIETKTGIVSKMTVALDLIEKMSKQDKILVGGAVAYTFLVAEKFLGKVKQGLIGTIKPEEIKSLVGDSFLEWEQINDQISIAGKMLLKAKERDIEVVIPRDHMVRNKKSGEIKNFQENIPEGWYGIDIGIKSLKNFIKIIDNSGFVIMSGPVGIVDNPKIPEASKGSEEIIKEMEKVTKKGTLTISAGGDTTLLVNRMKAKISHISIGGGSTLELIEKGTLAGIEALKHSAKIFG